jgi:hypothetical protein
MRQALAADPALPPRRLVAESTANPAKALGLRSVIGGLQTYSLADLLVIPHDGSTWSAEEALIHHAGPVGATLVAGRWEWISPSFRDRIPQEIPR